MATVNEQINDAITLVADRGIVFSVDDVAVYASLEGLESRIEAVLHEQYANETLVQLDERQKLFLNLSAVEKWWVARTLRCAASSINYLSPSQLAHSMSLSFLRPDDEQWHTPPTSLLDVGRHWAMVADGCVRDTFVFPWATVLSANPHLLQWFQVIFVSKTSASWSRDLFDDTYIEDNWQRLSTEMSSLHLSTPIDAAVDKVLGRLSEREI